MYRHLLWSCLSDGIGLALLLGGDLRRELGGAVPVEEAAPLPDKAPLADALLVDAERTAQIHECLGKLDERTRTHISSAFFDGFTYAELAERADVPLGTMKSWIRRGLKRLRTCLEASE